MDELYNTTPTKKSKELDDLINNLSYKFSHKIRKSLDGVIDISMYVIDPYEKKIIQGYSSINNGILENVFEVTLQKHDISTAMYKFLDQIGFDKVRGLYSGRGSLNTNYIEFMKVYNTTRDKTKAAFATPAGKALNKALNNKFIPNEKEIIIDENTKAIIIEWIKK
ncbi:hypothetical protein DI487_06760 [Flavobacterium sediminis]|uniref:Uncharacterized protein n=1 Tax=Flavobacterium sediminis TaxID=2201181 RepID=A0A2U8QU23_9FLAO|nr:hypothetical protein [Flavobacterium sediminis]AWM13591.1 hypothetical protein DI487_06760 [Flavobacterium sediminis]